MTLPMRKLASKIDTSEMYASKISYAATWNVTEKVTGEIGQCFHPWVTAEKSWSAHKSNFKIHVALHYTSLPWWRNDPCWQLYDGQLKSRRKKRKRCRKRNSGGRLSCEPVSAWSAHEQLTRLRNQTVLHFTFPLCLIRIVLTCLWYYNKSKANINTANEFRK